MNSHEPNEQELQILSLMKESRIFWQARKQLTNKMAKAERNCLPQQIIANLGNHQQKLLNLISSCLQKSTRKLPIESETNPEIGAYRVKWSEGIAKQFNNISTKILRNQQYDQEDQSVSYIYDPMSLLEFLSSIKIKTSIKVRDSSVFLFCEDILKAKTYQHFKDKYQFLNNQQNFLGTAYEVDQENKEKRQKKAKKIVDGQCISTEVEQFLCFGCVNGQRVNVYKRYFQCFYQYNAKRIDFNLIERVWKPLVKADSRDVLNNQTYFVFKQEISKVFKIFLCDRQLAQMVHIKQLQISESSFDKFAPIHLTIPCKSFSTYIAPFCYTGVSVEDIYQIFRQIYANHFILLNTISSLPDSILSLCICFQDLLWSTQRKIVNKLQNLHIQPLRMVFPWMFYCFIGYIQVEQFFLLLDRIVGTKSLQILPLYCVSIFYKQKTAILEAKTQNQIQQLLEDSLQEDNFVQTIRQFFKYHL